MLLSQQKARKLQAAPSQAPSRTQQMQIKVNSLRTENQHFKSEAVRFYLNRLSLVHL